MSPLPCFEPCRIFLLLFPPRAPRPRVSTGGCACGTCSADAHMVAHSLAAACTLPGCFPVSASPPHVRFTTRSPATAFVCALSSGSASSRVSGANRDDISGANRPVTPNHFLGGKSQGGNLRCGGQHTKVSQQLTHHPWPYVGDIAAPGHGAAGRQAAKAVRRGLRLLCVVMTHVAA